MKDRGTWERIWDHNNMEEIKMDYAAISSSTDIVV